MTTLCAWSILTVINDEKVCMKFRNVGLNRMTGPITPMTCTSTLVTHTFLWWCHMMIIIFVLRLKHPRTLCGMQKLVCNDASLLEIIVPHYFVIGWLMVLHKIICPVMYSPFAIGISVDHFLRSLSQWFFISQYLKRFGFINVDDSKPVFLSDLRGFPFSGCGWSMKRRVFPIVTIVCLLRNIPHVSTSSYKTTTFLLFGKRLG